MPFAGSTLAIGIATGQVALDEGAAQEVGMRRDEFGESLESAAEGKDGKPGEILSYHHLTESSMPQPA
jgi:hypothetical protein